MKKFKKSLGILVVSILTFSTFAQVGIGTNTPNSSSILELSSTDKGLLVPRMTLLERLAILNPSNALLVYQTDGSSGFYFYNGTAWSKLANIVDATYSGGPGISITANQITNTSPDQTVTLTPSGNLTVSGVYPNFTVTSAPYTAGTGISVSGNVITNSQPDQTVVLTGTGATTVSGTYPNFTINSTNTDAQTLSLSGSTLAISGGNSLSLSSINTDAQTLSLSGSSLTISGGNTVSLASLSGGSSLWSSTGSNQWYITSVGTGNTPMIRYGNGDLSGQAMGGTGAFFGTASGEDSGIFGDGDRVGIISPADGGNVVEFWEEDGHVIVATINGGGTYSQVSDPSKKENIKPLTNSLNKLKQLNGYSYSFKQSAEDIRKGTPIEFDYGFMADELEKVAPELVQKTSQGHVLVNYSGVVPMLVEAIKTQQSEIDQLKEELKSLHEEISNIHELLKSK